jgi:hypothetical protein
VKANGSAGLTFGKAQGDSCINSQSLANNNKNDNNTLFIFLKNKLNGFLKLKGGYFSVYLLILQRHKE